MNQDASRIRVNTAQPGVFEMGQYDSRFDRLKSSSFDPRTLWDRVNGDEALLRELVGIFLDEYPMVLRNIGAGIRQQSFDQVRKFSHKLKGTALQFSGSGVSALAASLERMGLEKSLQDAERLFSNLEHETEELARSLQFMISEKGDAAD